MDLYEQKSAVSVVLGLLRGAGYDAYVMGGAARDLHHGREPKDYDIIILADADVVSVVGDLGLCDVVIPFGDGASMREVGEAGNTSAHLDFVVKVRHRGVAIDVIKYVEEFASPHEAVESFDMTINMAWIDEWDKIVLHERFPRQPGDKVELLRKADLPANRVAYLREKYPEYIYPDSAEVAAHLYNRAKEGV